MRVHSYRLHGIPLSNKSAIAPLMKLALWPWFIIRNERNGQKIQNNEEAGGGRGGGGGRLVYIYYTNKINVNLLLPN